MSDHHIDIDKHVRSYMVVFGALMALTVITVAIASLDVSVPVAIALALFIASIKGSLVAAIFMHLIDEKKFIYWLLLLTASFLVFLLFVPFFTSVTDRVGG